MDEDGVMLNEGERLDEDKHEEEKNENVPRKKPQKRRKRLLFQTIQKQLEFYFSDANLSRDRFLGKLIQDDPNVPLEILLKCNKIRAMASSITELAKAIKGSKILQLSEDKQTVCRITPFENKANVDECMIYVENVPPDATHEYVINIFSEYGKVVYVSLPKFHGTHTNKGFAFIEFNTPEEAKKALQVFWDKGCCLPTHMPPEKLCSIRTHELNAANTFSESGGVCDSSTQLRNIDSSRSEPAHKIEADTVEISSTKRDESEEIKKNITDIKEETTNISDIKEETTNISDIKEETINISDIKKETTMSCEPSVEIKSETEVTEKSKKRKLEDGDVSCGEATEMDESKPKKVKTNEGKNSVDTDESTQPENGVGKNKKRHRKKKKKTKEDSNEVFADGLLILSKKEWKRLRNKYLDMQKHKMKQVKARLYQAQSYYHKWKNDDSDKNQLDDQNNEVEQNADCQETGRVKYSPGIIIKVNFEKPISCVPTFKAEARKHSSVKYVDAIAGNWEAYLRCSTPEDAQALIKRQPWPQMYTIEGDEECEYWEKIKKDRADKLSSARIKERGKKKLLRKAEKMRGTHLLFN